MSGRRIKPKVNGGIGTVLIRITAAIFTLAVCAGALAGCADNASGQKPQTERPDDVVITPITVNVGTNRPGEEATDVPLNTQGSGVTPGPGGETQKPQTAAPTPVYDPQKPLSGVIICVDAGHQDKGLTEKEPCAPWGPEANSSINNTVMKAKATSGTAGVSTKKAEYAVNLEIALKLRAALEQQGATVVMCRETNSTSLSNRDRALMANENNCDLTFNIHCNGAENQSVSGIELYVRGAGDNTEAYAQRSKNEVALGQKLLDKLVTQTGAKKRNVNKSDAYTGINWRDHPTFIIECGYMSNPEEDVRLSTPEYQDKLVEAIVRFTVEDFIGR